MPALNSLLSSLLRCYSFTHLLNHPPTHSKVLLHFIDFYLSDHSPLPQPDADDCAPSHGSPESSPAARGRLGGLGEFRRRRRSSTLRVRGDASAVDLREHAHLGLRLWGSSPEVSGANLCHCSKIMLSRNPYGSLEPPGCDIWDSLPRRKEISLS